MLQMKRVLVPVDFSNRCAGVFPYIRALAQRYSTEVTLLHVVDDRPCTSRSMGMAELTVYVPNFEELAVELQRELDAYERDCLRGLRVRREVLIGDPARIIVKKA